jgi:hypothetical protein
VDNGVQDLVKSGLIESPDARSAGSKQFRWSSETRQSQAAIIEIVSFDFHRRRIGKRLTRDLA